MRQRGGVVASLLLQPRDVVVVLGLMVVVGGLTAAVGYEAGDGGSPRHTKAKSVLIAVTACSAVVTVAGLTAVLGTTTLWLLV